MKHNVLGIIDQSGDGPFDAVATIRYASRDIPVNIDRDDQSLDTALNLAADVVNRLDELDRHAKRIAVKNLLDTYNNGWSKYDEAQADGSFKTVVNPQLSEAEIEAKLSLRDVNVTGDQMIQFFYDDQRMFWGHSIIVCSLSGTAFTNAYAELFG